MATQERQEREGKESPLAIGGSRDELQQPQQELEKSYTPEDDDDDLQLLEEYFEKFTRWQAILDIWWPRLSRQKTD